VKDYWNDPPDEPSAPECCDEEMEVSKDGSKFICSHCGQVIENPPDIEETPIPEEIDLDLPNEEPLCPHKNEWGDCDKCDHESDIAYDSDRERRSR
jgi:hypothetical protein